MPATFCAWMIAALVISGTLLCVTAVLVAVGAPGWVRRRG